MSSLDIGMNPGVLPQLHVTRRRPGRSGGLDSAFVGAVAAADVAVSIIVIGTFTLRVFAQVSLLIICRTSGQPQGNRSGSGHHRRSSRFPPF